MKKELIGVVLFLVLLANSDKLPNMVYGTLLPNVPAWYLQVSTWFNKNHHYSTNANQEDSSLHGVHFLKESVNVRVIHKWQHLKKWL